MGPDDVELQTFNSDNSEHLHKRRQSRKSQDEVEKKKTFREKARLLLESPKFHIAVLTLVITELIMVVIELMIDASGVAKNGELETAEMILKCISIFILSIFIVENLFTLFVLRCEFFHNCLEVFDSVVVITSFVLEVVFLNRHDAATGVGILIGLRLWRIVRVINGIAVAVKAQLEKKLEEERELREETETELKKYIGLSKKQQRYILHLEKFIQTHGLEISPRNSIDDQ